MKVPKPIEALQRSRAYLKNSRRHGHCHPRPPLPIGPQTIDRIFEQLFTRDERFRLGEYDRMTSAFKGAGG